MKRRNGINHDLLDGLRGMNIRITVTWPAAGSVTKLL